MALAWEASETWTGAALRMTVDLEGAAEDNHKREKAACADMREKRTLVRFSRRVVYSSRTSCSSGEMAEEAGPALVLPVPGALALEARAVSAMR